MSAKEQWRALTLAPGYWVSSNGRMKTTTRWITTADGKHFIREGKVLPLTVGALGYPVVSLPICTPDGVLSGKWKVWYVHHCVLLAFVGPLPAGMETRHLDGVKTNNYLSNLCYGTPTENRRDQQRHGSARGKLACTLTDDDVFQVRTEYAAGGVLQIELARKYKVSRTTMNRILRGLARQHINGPLLPLRRS